MTTIVLPPDLEGRVVEKASLLGVTPEYLAVAELRKVFDPVETLEDRSLHETLFEYLGNFVGAVEGASEPLSENCGKHFAEGLAEKEWQGRP